MKEITIRRTWKEKHDDILKNKKDIIKKYNNGIPIKEIAKMYEVSTGCINNNLNLWGIRKKHGIKYLLGKMLSEEANQNETDNKRSTIK